jgi:hypothetical protein
MKLCDFKKVFRSLDGHQSVRIWVLIIGGLQVGFWLYPPSTRIRSATEWNGSLWRLATGILVMFVWPPLQFAAKNELLFLALLLTSAGALMNMALFVEIAREFAE